MSVVLAQAGIDDLYTLQKISRETFSETFAHLNTAENMRKYLDEDLSLQRLEEEIKKSAFSFLPRIPER